MLLETFSLSLSLLLFVPSYQPEIAVKKHNILAKKCTHIRNCKGQITIIAEDPSPNDWSDSKPNKKTCKDKDKVLQEGAEIERHGVKLVCKNGELKERSNEKP